VSGESFIHKAEREGSVASLLGAFTSTDTRFDRLLKGLAVSRVDEERGEVECVMPVDEACTNAFGTLHGGMTATLVDVVGTLALLTRDSGRPGVSVEISTSYVAAVKEGDSVRCVGRVTKHGRRLGFTQVDIFRVSDGKLAASGRHTKAL